MKACAPWREQYLQQRDSEVYEGLVTFFTLVQKYLWDSAGSRSYIRKTVGIQALFDLLRFWLKKSSGTVVEGELDPVVAACGRIDFSDPVFQASGKGRTRVKNALLLCAGLISLNETGDQDRDVYGALLNKYPKQSIE